jgi:hypothetical protein
MTSFWLLVCAGCAASAAFGFSFVRFAVPGLPKFRGVDPVSSPLRDEMPERSPRPVAIAPSAVRERPVARMSELPEPQAPTRKTPRPAVAPATSATKRRAATPRRPRPTAPAPEAAKLALWARQVKAGERMMSVATDGCRVTWDRTCKHGHPTWLVRLGYLKAKPPEA